MKIINNILKERFINNNIKNRYYRYNHKHNYIVPIFNFLSKYLLDDILYTYYEDDSYIEDHPCYDSIYVLNKKGKLIYKIVRYKYDS